jgi:hypothetical protein
MHYLSLIYFVIQPLYVSEHAHHQEVFTAYVQQLVCIIRSGDWQLPVTRMYNTYQLLYIYSKYLLMTVVNSKNGTLQRTTIRNGHASLDPSFYPQAGMHCVVRDVKSCYFCYLLA